MNIATVNNKIPKTKENYQYINTILFIIINLFLIGLPTFCLIYKNSQTIKFLNYPVSSQGKSCYLEFQQSYRYLYADLNRKKMVYRCVNQCPSMINSYTIIDSNGMSIVAPESQQVGNYQLGGVCWSALKQKLIKERGLLHEFQAKTFLLNKFQSIVLLCGISFILGTLSLFIFYCLPPRIVYIATILISFVLLGLFLYFVFHQSTLFYKTQLIILIGVILVFFVINLIIFREKLLDSIQFSQQFLQKLSLSPSSSAKFCKFITIDTFFSVLHCGLLILILWSYVGIVSSQPLIKNQNKIYYNIGRTWWKYIILLYYWLLFSILLQKIYQFLIIKNGYSCIKKEQRSTCFTFEDILNIYHFTLIETLLWIPIKLIKLIKPQGSIVNQGSQESFSQKMSRCCYCLCGLPINFLHKLTFNPFLVLALQPTFNNLDDSLGLVQQVYHKNDPYYDRTSLWVSPIVQSCIVCRAILMQVFQLFSQ